MRQGVLSDAVIKTSYPEFQPLNLGVADALEDVVFEKHPLTGIKLPKEYKRRRNSRFPIYDINNFSSLAQGQVKEKLVYEATNNYRKKFGSSNVIQQEVIQNICGENMDMSQRANYMSSNFELRKKGGLPDRVNTKGISQEAILARLPSRNKNDLLLMNKNLRNSGIGMDNLERRMNSALLSNLENSKGAFLARGLEERKTADFVDAMMNVNLQTRYRKHKMLMGTGRLDPADMNMDFEDEINEDSNTHRENRINMVSYPQETRFGFGSYRDKIMEEEYIALTGRKPRISIVEPRFRTEVVYSAVDSDYTNQIRESGEPVNTNVKEVEGLPLEGERVVMPQDPEKTRAVPEDLAGYIREREAKKLEDPEYARKEKLKIQRLNKLHAKANAGQPLTRKEENDLMKLSPMFEDREILAQESLTPYDELSTSNERLKSNKYVKSRKEAEIMTETMKHSRGIMVDELTKNFYGVVVPKMMKEVINDMNLTDEEANQLQNSLTQFIDTYHKYPSRRELEDMVAQFNVTHRDPRIHPIGSSSSSQDPENIRRLDNEERLINEMVRAAIREQEHDEYWQPD